MTSATDRRPQVALVSMPWASAWMPSIQLSILRQCLHGVADHDTFELYVDYAGTISSGLYRKLADAGGIIEEWLFAQSYFRAEGVAMPEGFLDVFPPFGLKDRETERAMVETLAEVTDDFLDRLLTRVDWARYDIVAFTLSIYQTAPSMALARLIKRLHPRIQVVFGGNSCVGAAAGAIMEICPYVDVVVRTEAEPVFADLVRCLTQGTPLDRLPGVTRRNAAGVIVDNPAGGLSHPQRVVSPPVFDSYYERFERSGIRNPDKIWLPFESSRGCWWGEKSQCTFCGLHEIMEYRARPAEDVLEELDSLHERYGATRFFSTDLIMPQEYYRTFLPALIKSRRPYRFFYELKANTTRVQMAKLAAAGVRNVQPGLESLSSKTLKLMKKGIKASQNVQFLKWANEYGIEAGWNYIIGIPLENPAEHDLVAETLPTLHHFPPPSVSRFELDRYSPIFEDYADHGLTDVQPLAIYHYLFPIDDRLLNDLVYRFQYHASDFDGQMPPWLSGSSDNYAGRLYDALDAWRKAFEAGASLVLSVREDGSAEITDTRGAGPARVYSLSRDETTLYGYLDSMMARRKVADNFARDHADVHARIGGNGFVDAQVGLWLEDRLLFEEGGLVVAVAVPEQPLLTIDEHNADADGKALSLPGPGAPAQQASRGDPFPAREPAISGYLRAAGVLPPGVRVAGVERRTSSGHAFVARLSDGCSVFLKQVAPEADSEARITAARAAGALPEELVRLLVPCLHYDAERGVAVYEAIDGHVAWMDLLVESGGYRQEIARSAGHLLARLHAIEPQGLAEWLQGDSTVRVYDELTVDEFARAPGMHFSEFLRCAQPASGALHELRARWRPELVVHGDCKADNVLVAQDPANPRPRLVDWELTRLGPATCDLGTLVGSIIQTWLSSVRPGSGASVEEWFSAADVSSVTLQRTLSALLAAYAEGGGDRTVVDDDDLWRYAGAYLLDRGYAANWAVGRFSVREKLAVELGARLLAAPEAGRDTFLGAVASLT